LNRAVLSILLSSLSKTSNQIVDVNAIAWSYLYIQQWNLVPETF